MIHLVLQRPGEQPFGLEFHRVPVQVRAANPRHRRALHLAVDAGNAEAGLGAEFRFSRKLDLRVQEHHRHVFVHGAGFAADAQDARTLFCFARVEDDNAARHADLVGREAAAVVGIHRLEHILGEATQGGIDFFDRFGFGPQGWMAKFGDRQHGATTRQIRPDARMPADCGYPHRAAHR